MTLFMIIGRGFLILAVLWRLWVCRGAQLLEEAFVHV